MTKQLELSSLSQSERDERLAAAVTQYGVGTKSYNSSGEKKELKRQQADATARYHAGELNLGNTTVGPFCTCRSFNLPHEVAKHAELRGEWDWRTESERRGIQRYQERVK